MAATVITTKKIAIREQGEVGRSIALPGRVTDESDLSRLLREKRQVDTVRLFDEVVIDEEHARPELISESGLPDEPQTSLRQSAL